MATEHEVFTATADLRTLLTDLARSAATDETLPAINGVLLHTDTTGEQPLLVGTSTDRFVMAQAHIDVLSGQLPETFVFVPDLQLLLTALAPREDIDDDVGEGNVRLLRAGNTLTLYRDQVVRIDLWDMEFPPIRQHFAPQPGARQSTQLAPEYLQMFAEIAASRGAPAVALTIQDDATPVLVHIGERYRAVVMRTADRLPPPPALSIPPHELAREAQLAASGQ